jgi:hypothetical protein
MGRINLVIYGIMLVVMTLCYMLFFGVSFRVSSALSICFYVCGAYGTFSLPGCFVRYESGGFQIGAAPMIVLSITLWLCSGALNPLEFSAGSAFSNICRPHREYGLCHTPCLTGEQFVRESFFDSGRMGRRVLLLVFVGLFLHNRKRVPKSV